MTESKKPGSKIILDTCVLLEYFLNSKKADEVEKLLNKIVSGELEGHISSSTITEITTIFIRENAENKIPEVLDFLKNSFLIIDTTPEIAFLAGTIKAKYQTREKGLSHVDAVICASAILFDCTIVTYDSEFDRVSEVIIKRPQNIK
ncbi:MAG: tRNA(fMet)-specific endonuclease VapC [Candidatus Methanoperedens nitroreducens]|uniref:Putative PIN domain protein n=1 Tax=Candidatus Methanoperedens nitratireducens TaxID=1392998 RepID=A0A0P8ABF0_9EURY|nr:MULTISPECIES: PIN domain-containing protein [Methanoperedens]KAB2942085.1 MAG: type II toxin-antitoxin system VapC family toxin [Candidatus Methanoperedens sp.]KPQ41305.1 MAG: tRNA(fMet)-specific endonuclease VapC [Candidatus Methanoperedens sp. BLZ1]MBZ0176128.1 PIN domain-containing protein [Candidatus Methanoperedens nitroreducens]MCX9079998.1 PIN domain-containing protein [Candidatus Methanoperedens sp.]MCX9089495.1 PIN domain-containing protein [Candidatus Methanoperedens sp.]